MSNQLIIALDYEKAADALALVDLLDPTTCAVKVGSELFTRFGTQFVTALVERQFNVFLDLKFHDIPNTVACACKAAADLGVWMLTLHASGGIKMMMAAKQAVQTVPNPPLLVAVTVLTSMQQSDLTEQGVNSPLHLHVLQLAQMAETAGLDGVVCSAHEVPLIKAQCGSSFLAVTPGIRLEGQSLDDQVRTSTVESALQVGSDYLVVGRSITRAAYPRQVLSGLLKTLAQFSQPNS